MNKKIRLIISMDENENSSCDFELMCADGNTIEEYLTALRIAEKLLLDANPSEIKKYGVRSLKVKATIPELKPAVIKRKDG